MLIASLALIFDEPEGLNAHRRVQDLLSARRSISLLARPVAWGELSVAEMVIAVNPEGFIVMADDDGNTSYGQQIEGFAIALKRGTGALFADFDGVDAEGGEPIEDPRLDHPGGGRSVLLGSFKESEVAMFAGVTKTAWKYFSTEHGDVAIHEGYMPEIMLSKSAVPAIMLSRTGPRFSMVFWFQGQSRKLHGYPGFGHGWSVAAEPVLDVVPGTPAAKAVEFLQREWAEPDLEAIAELREFGVDEEQLAQLNQVLSGSGSLDAVKRVLGIFGKSPELADYLEQAPIPASAVDVEPRGFTGSISASMSAESREATGIRKFLNPFAWRPRLQMLWGVFEGIVAALIITLTNWSDPWMNRWIIILIVVAWSADALANLGLGLRRLLRERRAQRPE
ncbi:hypothetical protein [Paeniglutamicibacter kerguelensis]|uniref:Uncharacterized protein n=1 Tax=Paeniglutamicibacter kerguelensis TaxID=254788 RepID=A0ABS4XAY1_9MICC|nr:hypothetical protein [Paeniglutamicibacter kerguelensis]MBP2385632.1 hypothetical protein [Paeniglutamicibacter kerguelensis]